MRYVRCGRGGRALQAVAQQVEGVALRQQHEHAEQRAAQRRRAAAAAAFLLRVPPPRLDDGHLLATDVPW